MRIIILVILFYLTTIISARKRKTIVDLLKSGELNKQVELNISRVTCFNILRHKLFMNPNWIAKNLLKMDHTIEDYTFIIEFVNQCTNIVNNPEYLFSKNFIIGGIMINFTEELFHMDIVDFSYHI